MTTRDIQEAIKDLYHGVEISHSVISNVTEAVMDEVEVWQNRHLAVKKASEKWTRPLGNWKPSMNRFAIEYEGRFDCKK